jgi:hypothetical protein
VANKTHLKFITIQLPRYRSGVFTEQGMFSVVCAIINVCNVSCGYAQSEGKVD